MWLADAGLLDARYAPATAVGHVSWALSGSLDSEATSWAGASVSEVAVRRRHTEGDPHARLWQVVEQAAQEAGVDPEALREGTPRRWERLGELVLLPQQACHGPAWEAMVAARSDLWWAMAAALGGTRLGRQAGIDQGPRRESRAGLLHGEDGWVNHREGGVVYRFDALRSMFSSGNTTERRRLGELDATGEVVLDCYAGIGYYTLPLLVRAGAAHVHACEWNPHSLEGLRAGLLVNGVTDRCTIHEGDNREVGLAGIADRVVLGLLPHSEDAWPLAVRALRPTGGVLHVHANVGGGEQEAWTARVMTDLSRLCVQEGRPFSARLVHRERVKSYAPHVWHLVADVQLDPA